jgi:hypothetical protein
MTFRFPMDDVIGSLMQNFSGLSILLSVFYQQLVDWVEDF